jgi:hypothetical protein
LKEKDGGFSGILKLRKRYPTLEEESAKKIYVTLFNKIL